MSAVEIEDKKKFAGGLAKVGIDLADAKPASALKGFIDVVLQLRKPAEKGVDAETALGLLIRRAAAESAVTVFREFRHVSFAAGAIDPAEVAAQLRAAALPLPDLSAKAFAAPDRWAAVPELERLFSGWLDACHVPADKRALMTSTFADELPFALRGEWLNAVNAKDYAALVVALGQTTPFDRAANEAAQWRDYRAKLAADIRQPLRSVAPDKIPRFSLEQLYIPLNAMWEDRKARNQETVDLHQALATWIDAADQGDFIRVVTGGPGSGKSSACRMLAADLARQGRKVLLAPLGRLEYNREAVGALRQWTQENLGHDPLTKEALREGQPLVLILDGLDELVKVGKIGEQVVANFVTELNLRIANLNEDGVRVLLLLVGRPLAAEQAHRLARKPEAWLEARRFDNDQREGWWRKFSVNGLPAAVNNHGQRLDDVSRQPLLNWLLAQVLTLNADENIGNVHDLYERLLREVIKRTHRNPNSEAIDTLDDGVLEQLLEEVAVAAWHDGDRSVKLSTIRARLTRDYQQALDALSRKDDTAAIEAILDSFFCAPRGGGGDDRVFEFTHKSFREFLTVRRMLREVGEIIDDLPRSVRHGLDPTLQRWFALCGPTAMDRDLLRALRDAVAADDFSTVDARGAAMRTLLAHTSHHGFPLPKRGDWDTRELDRQARNAEEALLAVHSSCAIAYTAKHPEHRPPPLALDWGNDGNADPGRWLNKLHDRNLTITSLCINNIYLFELLHHRANLSYAGLSYADLRRANLSYAGLSYANLRRVDLSGANLSGADLTGANLFDADLSGANLSDANLNDANLYDADLTGADLGDANLGGANLGDANLFDANLYDADLTGANLSGADLTGANLGDANLSDANLFDANLTGADLRRADLSGANLSDANLSDANLSYANLSGANLFDANLFDANLTGANLFDADLSGANLDNVQGLTEGELADLKQRAASS